MTAIKNFYRRLDKLQRKLWLRFALSGLVLVLCGTTFGWLIAASTSLDSQRQSLIEAMMGQNLAERDDHAVSLAETGRVYLNGREYGNDRLAERADLIFDDRGNLAVQPATLAEVLLRDKYPTAVPRWLVEQPGTAQLLGGVTLVWLMLIVWMEITLPFLLTLAGTAAACALSMWLGSRQAAWAFGGIGLLTFTFVLLTRASLILYQRPNQILAVAHTVIKEASRTRIPLVFIVLILILLPLLPLGLDPQSPLRFQIQTFISRSLGFTFYLAACMTLFLSCATVAFEIRDRQIWQLMTKPVGRINYLLGKWLGVITINLVIMAIAAVSSFTFIQYLREQPVARGIAGQEDAQQVRDAVLTARLGSKPVHEQLDDRQIESRIDYVIETTPELAELEEVSLMKRRQLREQLEKAWVTGQRSIPPQMERLYLFENLGPARGRQSTLTLRYRFHILRDDEHKTFNAAFYFNGDRETAVSRTFVPTVSHVLSIPSSFVREDGTMTVTVANLFQPLPSTRGSGALNFEEKDFELLYRAGSFEGNFFRAVTIDWIKLSFLAMFGICCATFLSFPVACLTSFTVFTAGTIGPFLASSLDQYYPPSFAAIEPGNIGMMIQWAFQSFIRLVAQGIVIILEGFGEYRPTQSLVEGRLIEWKTVAEGLFKVGVIWSGLALFIGYVVMRKRQLAIYSGHG